MLNEKPNEAVKEFARAVLAFLKTNRAGTWDQYVPADVYHKLRALALEAGGEMVGEMVELGFNARVIKLSLGGAEVAPVIAARKQRSGEPFGQRCSIRKAVLVMLDKLPQVPREHLAPLERRAVMQSAGLAIVGPATAKKLFQHEVFRAAYWANEKQLRKLLRAYPRMFHKVLKNAHNGNK